MKKLLLASLTALALSPGAHSQQTKILTAEKHNEYGLIYSLPTTALKITVVAEKVTSTPGPYYQYSKKFLGKSSVITDKSTRWTIKEVTAQPIGVNDENTQYLMQLKPGATTYIGVDSDGMLLSINARPSDSTDNTAKGRNRSEGKGLNNAQPAGGNLDDYLQYVDMDFISSQSSMKQAEMIASSLMDVRDAYLSLTRGTADNMPTDGRQLELMLNSLKEQEDALTRAFAGMTETETVSRDYIYIPEGEGEEILFRMSDFAGFVDTDDYSGEPVYITTDVLLEGKLPADQNGEEKKLPKDAVVYSVPGTARITISTGQQTLLEEETEFSQFGTVFGLSPSLFTDKKAPSYAIFNPATGALVELGKVTEE